MAFYSKPYSISQTHSLTITPYDYENKSTQGTKLMGTVPLLHLMKLLGIKL